LPPEGGDVRVLGTDPGTAITGYGVVESDGDHLAALAYGVITTPAGWGLAQRLQEIYRQLRALAAEWRPESAAVEELFFSKNARTALLVGHARGVGLLALADAGLPVHEYKPAEIKQAVTGYGAAPKPQVQSMVQHLLGLAEPPSPDDAADALAVAICHVHSARWRSLTLAGDRSTRC
jgi:crossover junction endodeoxyribonuclease RuvC